MKNLIKNFLVEEQGQDLIEYTLLLAFVCLASAALFVGVGGQLNTIWGDANTLVNNAASAAAS